MCLYPPGMIARRYFSQVSVSDSQNRWENPLRPVLECWFSTDSSVLRLTCRRQAHPLTPHGRDRHSVGAMATLPPHSKFALYLYLLVRSVTFMATSLTPGPLSVNIKDDIQTRNRKEMKVVDFPTKKKEKLLLRQFVERGQ